ncbi:hypothetical protein H4R35_002361 [Dimargaris xerosporica]|nr:hypothetical protein H4R35_002361 [Dimargaris xerosporica]
MTAEGHKRGADALLGTDGHSPIPCSHTQTSHESTMSLDWATQGQLAELDRIIRRYAYESRLEAHCATRLAHRLFTLIVAARKAVQLPVLLDKLHLHLQAQNLAPFVQLHRQVGVLESQLIDTLAPAPHASPTGTFTLGGSSKSSGDFMYHIPPRSSKAILQFVSLLRKHPDLLATALVEMPSHELDALAQTRAGPLHGSLLHTLLFSLFGPRQCPSEERCRLALWRRVFVELLRARKGERFLLKVLERWVAASDIQNPSAMGRLETLLIRIAHQAAKLPRWLREPTSQPNPPTQNSQRWAALGVSLPTRQHMSQGSLPIGTLPLATHSSKASMGALGSHPVELNAFYDDACADILAVIPHIIPPALTALTQQVFADLAPESHVYASLIIILRFFFHRFLQRILTAPESYGLMEDHYISDAQRETIFYGIYQRLYRHAQAGIVPVTAQAPASTPCDPRMQALIHSVVCAFQHPANTESASASPFEAMSAPLELSVYPPPGPFNPTVGPILCMTATDILQLHTFLQTWWQPLVMPKTQLTASSPNSPLGTKGRPVPTGQVGLPTPPPSNTPGRSNMPRASTEAGASTCGTRTTLAKELRVYQSQLLGILIGSMRKAVDQLQSVDAQAHTVLVASEASAEVCSLHHLTALSPTADLTTATTDEAVDLIPYLKKRLSNPDDAWFDRVRQYLAIVPSEWSPSAISAIVGGVQLIHRVMRYRIQRYDVSYDASQPFLVMVYAMARLARSNQDLGTVAILQRTTEYLTEHLPFSAEMAPIYAPLLTLLTDYYHHKTTTMHQRRTQRLVWSEYHSALEQRLRHHLRHRQVQFLTLSLRGFYSQVRQTAWFNDSRARIRRWSHTPTLTAKECQEVKAYLKTHNMYNILTGEDRLHRLVMELASLRDRSLKLWPTWIAHGALTSPVSQSAASTLGKPGADPTAAMGQFSAQPFTDILERHFSFGSTGRDPAPRFSTSRPAHPSSRPVLRTRRSRLTADFTSDKSPLLKLSLNSPELRPSPGTNGPSDRLVHATNEPAGLGTKPFDPADATLTTPPPLSCPVSPAFVPGLTSYFNPSSEERPSPIASVPLVRSASVRPLGSGGDNLPIGRDTLSQSADAAPGLAETFESSGAFSAPSDSSNVDWWQHGWLKSDDGKDIGVGGFDPVADPFWCGASQPGSDLAFQPFHYHYSFSGFYHYTLVKGDWSSYLGLKLMSLMLSEYLTMFRYSATDAWLREYLTQACLSPPLPEMRSSAWPLSPESDTLQSPDSMSLLPLTRSDSRDRRVCLTPPAGDGEAVGNLPHCIKPAGLTNSKPAVHWDTHKSIRTVTPYPDQPMLDPLQRSPSLVMAFDTFRQQFYLHPAPLHKLRALIEFEQTLVEHMAYRIGPWAVSATPAAPLGSLAHEYVNTQLPGTDAIVQQLEQCFRYHRPKCFLRDLQLLVMVLPSSLLDFSSAGKVFWDVATAMATLKGEGVAGVVKEGLSLLEAASQSRTMAASHSEGLSPMFRSISRQSSDTGSQLSDSGILSRMRDDSNDSGAVVSTKHLDQHGQIPPSFALSTSIPLGPQLASPPMLHAHLPPEGSSLSSSFSSPDSTTISPLLAGQKDDRSGSFGYGSDWSVPVAHVRHGSTGSDHSLRTHSTTGSGRTAAQALSAGPLYQSSGGFATAAPNQSETNYQLQALRYFSIAAREGNAEAQRELGILYLSLPVLGQVTAFQDTTMASSEDTDDSIDIDTGDDGVNSAFSCCGANGSEAAMVPCEPGQVSAVVGKGKPSPPVSLKLTIPQRQLAPHLSRQAPTSAPVAGPSMANRITLGNDLVGSPRSDTSPCSNAHVSPPASHLPVPPMVTPATVTAMSTPIFSGHSLPPSAADEAHSSDPSPKLAQAIESDLNQATQSPGSTRPNPTTASETGQATSEALDTRPNRSVKSVHGSSGFMSTSSFKSFFSPILGSGNLFSAGKATKGSSRTTKIKISAPQLPDANASVETLLNLSSSSPVVASGTSVRGRSSSMSVTAAAGQSPYLANTILGSTTSLSMADVVTDNEPRLLAGTSTCSSPKPAPLYRSASTHGHYRGTGRPARPLSILGRETTTRSGLFAGSLSGLASTRESSVAGNKDDGTKYNLEHVSSAIYWFQQAASQGDAVASKYLRHRDGPMSLLSNLSNGKSIKGKKRFGNSEMAAAASASAASLAATRHSRRQAHLEATGDSGNLFSPWPLTTPTIHIHGSSGAWDSATAGRQASGSAPVTHAKRLGKRRASLFAIPSAASSNSSLSSMSSLATQWPATAGPPANSSVNASVPVVAAPISHEPVPVATSVLPSAEPTVVAKPVTTRSVVTTPPSLSTFTFSVDVSAPLAATKQPPLTATQELSNRHHSPSNSPRTQTSSTKPVAPNTPGIGKSQRVASYGSSANLALVPSTTSSPATSPAMRAATLNLPTGPHGLASPQTSPPRSSSPVPAVASQHSPSKVPRCTPPAPASSSAPASSHPTSPTEHGSAHFVANSRDCAGIRSDFRSKQALAQ